MSAEKKLMWLLAIIACPLVALAVCRAGRG